MIIPVTDVRNYQLLDHTQEGHGENVICEPVDAIPTTSGECSFVSNRDNASYCTTGKSSNKPTCFCSTQTSTR